MDINLVQYFKINQSIHHINRLTTGGKKSHIPINKCKKKKFDKFQQPFVIKTLRNIGLDGIFFPGKVSVKNL